MPWMTRNARYVRSDHSIQSLGVDISDQDASGDTLKEIDEAVAKASAEIERLAPSMKVLDRCVL